MRGGEKREREGDREMERERGKESERGRDEEKGKREREMLSEKLSRLLLYALRYLQVLLN